MLTIDLTDEQIISMFEQLPEARRNRILDHVAVFGNGVASTSLNSENSERLTGDVTPDDSIINEFIVQVKEFQNALENADGLYHAYYVRLRTTLIALKEAWKERDCIPRIAVSLFIDLPEVARKSSYNYVGAERERMIDLSKELHELVRDVVATDANVLTSY